MKLFTQRNGKRKGFTMIELMVVIAIIAILVLLVAPKLLGNTDKARTRVFEANFRTLMSETSMAYAEGGTYTEVNDHATKMAGKPVAGVAYKIDGNVLKAKYNSYILNYDPSTGVVSVAGASTVKGPSFTDTTPAATY